MRKERQKPCRSAAFGAVRPNGEEPVQSENNAEAPCGRIMGSEALGRLVRSNAGHDRGSYLVIIGVADDGRVFTADGKLRTVSKPKLKKLRHLTVTDRASAELAEKLISGRPILDAELRKYIASETADESASAPEVPAAETK